MNKPQIPAEKIVPGTTRLQLVLARAGVASRRQAGEIIAAGRVTVNNSTITEAGIRVNPLSDKITVDGKPLPPPEQLLTVLIYKPRGYICSASSQQGRSVCTLVPLGERLVPVGRLDKESEGLLLLSNDGDFINRFTHPRYGYTKTYRVTVKGSLTAAALQSLATPVEIDGRLTRPARVGSPVSSSGSSSVEIILGEGRNRQVRQLCDRAGLRIARLVRVALGNLRDPSLKPGMWRYLSAHDYKLIAPPNQPPPG